MIVDIAWSGGLVVGIQHTDCAVIETAEDEYEFCNAIIISLGFFNISFLFIQIMKTVAQAGRASKNLGYLRRSLVQI